MPETEIVAPPPRRLSIEAKLDLLRHSPAIKQSIDAISKVIQYELTAAVLSELPG